MRLLEELHWPESPKASPKEIVEFYATQIGKRTDGKATVMIAPVIEPQGLHIYALIDEDEKTEYSVYSAKFDVLRQWPDAPVRFTIYRKGDKLPSVVEQALLASSS